METKDIIFKNFLSRITDDMFVTWTVEETKAELEDILSNAIPKFRFPKVALIDATGELSAGIGIQEIEILSALMVREWIDRQIHTVELTEMQYTGSDAKAMNTGGQMRSLEKVKEAYMKNFNKQLDYYHLSEVGTDFRVKMDSSINMSGKVRANGKGSR